MCFRKDPVQSQLGWFLVVEHMPPKKKQRVVGNQKTDGGAALTMQDVSPLQLKLKDWICQLYSLRHGSSEKLAWPIENGGSLLATCQRCWKERDGMLNASLSLLQKMGVMADSSTTADLTEKFVTCKDDTN